MIFDLKEIITFSISIVALVISGISLVWHISDTIPTLKVGFYIDEEIEPADKYETLPPIRYFSLVIVNHSSRRIKVANISIELKKSKWFGRKKQKRKYPDFRKAVPTEVISSFWIEPWGDESIIAHENEFENWLQEESNSKNYWARIIVTDALGKSYYSQILRIP